MANPFFTLVNEFGKSEYKGWKEEIEMLLLDNGYYLFIRPLDVGRAIPSPTADTPVADTRTYNIVASAATVYSMIKLKRNLPQSMKPLSVGVTNGRALWLGSHSSRKYQFKSEKSSRSVREFSCAQVFPLGNGSDHLQGTCRILSLPVYFAYCHYPQRVRNCRF